MNEYIALGVIIAVFAIIYIIFKKTKVKEDDKSISADTILPTPPKPPKGEIPK